jgi:hypothetical protein
MNNYFGTYELSPAGSADFDKHLETNLQNLQNPLNAGLGIADEHLEATLRGLSGEVL